MPPDHEFLKGVNWYLTENDGTNDGKFTSYLDDVRMQRKCPAVFDVLKQIASEKNKSVKDIQRSGIIGDSVVFYDDLIKLEGAPSERKEQRSCWFSKSMAALSDAELIFMDPDNGLLENNDASKLGSEKYVLPDEVEKFFETGHDVVYYCHKGRRTFKAWLDYKSVMFDRIPEAKPAVLTYHKGTQRSYVFLIHEKSFVKYRKIIDRFMRDWPRDFSEEYTNRNDVSGEVIGQSFSIKKSDGTVITIQNRADGKVQIRSSKTPNSMSIVTADMFCEYLHY